MIIRSHLLIGLSLVGLAQPAQAMLQPAHVPVTVTHPYTAQLHITWNASVRETGGEFLVVRRAADGSLDVVARVMAGAGTSYELVESAFTTGPMAYDLIYLGIDGTAHFLATRFVCVEIMKDAPPSAVPHGPRIDPVVLSEPGAEPARIESSFVGPVVNAISIPSKPATPPPKA